MRSYRLLAADDEYWIREKLRSVIKWEKYDIDFMKPAENGEEVLERLSEEECDILITDINMPYVDGIELIKRVHEAYPDIVIFVVSGYDDFKYVKEALTTGATDYLLKQINKIDIVAVISKALEIIAKKESEKNEALRVSSLINDRELSFLVEREPALFNPMKEYDADGTSGHSLILIKIHDMYGYAARNRGDINALSYDIKMKIREISGKEGDIAFNYIYRANEFIVVSGTEFKELSDMAKRVADGLSIETGSPVTVAISTRGYNMDTLHGAYNESVSAYMMRTYRKCNEVIYFNDEKNESKSDAINKITPEIEMRLKQLYQTGNEEALKILIRNETGIIRASKEGWRYIEVKQTVKRICSALIECAAKEIAPQEIEDIESEAEHIDKSIEKLDISLLCELLDEFVGQTLAPVLKADTGSIKDAVHKAAEYIENNYFEEISLNLLAKQFNIENSYFSRVFKQETGSNVMQYIARLRMEKAVAYMENESINLTEIAFMVGYDDYNYFNRVFKKFNGMSPSEYRQMHLSKKSN
ncbi:MAG: response regulator [Lachnospiraceae bacterium]|nr:response regulator [Lachnospiraceae bacterium]